MGLSKGFSAEAKPQAAVGDPFPLPTLLVVDDEREITHSLADQFRKSFRVLTATSAAEAELLLLNHDVSVLVSDQRMPDKTGVALLADASRMNPDIVRILMTGYADIDAVIQSVNEGRIFFYLTKPWRHDELTIVLTKALEHSTLLRERRRLIEDLRLANVELEQRVQERTHQLEERNHDLEAANRRISEMMNTDALTGVANRRCLDETLAKEVSRCSRLELPLTVLLADVDHFKSVNDQFGHAMGDRVLQVIARSLGERSRPYDLVARYGGEEFLVIMPGATAEGGVQAAERYREGIGGQVLEGLGRPVTASFGVAALRPGESPSALVARADKALYGAKQNGRNRVVCDELREGD